MAIQIVGLRPFWSEKKKDFDVKEQFFPDVTAATPNQLFNELAKYIDKVPENERYNLYWTVAHSKKGTRTLVQQDIIPFDIDKIDTSKIDDYLPVLDKVLGCDPEKTVVIYTGNGIQYIIQQQIIAKEDSFFKDNRPHYRHWVDKINVALQEAGLVGECDASVFSPARLLRLPSTENRKPVNKPFDPDTKVRQATLKRSRLAVQEWKFVDPEFVLPEKHTIPKGSYGKVDYRYVLEQCQFLQWVKNSPSQVHEPHVYAMLSITAHFPDNNASTRELFAPLSSPSIDAMDLGSKIEQATNASGPRTCESISGLWDGCQKCPHWKSCKSPITLKGPDFIATEDIGFTLRDINSTGKVVLVRCYDDLRKYYNKMYKYLNITELKRVMIWNGTHFVQTFEDSIKCFAQDHFKPTCQKSQERMEFVAQVKAHNQAPLSVIQSANQENLINLKNGILNAVTGEFTDHDPEKGFTHVLDYDYDPKATCPTWETMLHNATCGRQELIDILEEFLFFTIAGISYTRYQQFLVLSGEGENGKSTFCNAVRSIVGDDNSASCVISTLNAEKYSVAQLEGKLLNISEEEDVKCFKETGILKKITGGESVEARHPYERPFQFRNKAKFIITYNEPPHLGDTSKGMTRRMLIIPFDQDFSKRKDLKMINVLDKIREERSGILNRILLAGKRLLEQDGFTKSEIVKREVRQLVLDSDVFSEWFEDFVEVTGKEEDRLTLQEAYSHYQRDMEIGKESMRMSYRGFAKRLQKMSKNFNFTIKKAIFNGNVTRAVIGVKISSGSETIERDARF